MATIDITDRELILHIHGWRELLAAIRASVA
jgi:hypothetical protein